MLKNSVVRFLVLAVLGSWAATDAGAQSGDTSKPGDGVGGQAPGGKPAVNLDEAVGIWGGAIGTKIDGGVLDSFRVGIDKTADGYEASTRADVTLAGEDSTKVVVITRYKGHAKDDGIQFESTERKRTVGDGKPELLVPASLFVQPKDGHIKARVGNEAEGFTDFTLVQQPKDDVPVLGGADGILGSWSGDQSKVKVGDTATLHELILDVFATGPWKSVIRMNWTVHLKDTDVPVVIDAEYLNGTVDGDSVKWEKVAWHRTVTETGQKSELEGNPLVLKVKADGGLDGKFEGADGFSFTVIRRGAPPKPRIADFAGKWGGDLHLAIDDGVVESLVIEIARTAEGTYTASTRGVYTVVNDAKKKVRIQIVGKYTGRLEGEKILFHSTSRQAGREDAAKLDDAEAGDLEVSRAIGKIMGRIGSDKSGWMTFSLVPKKD